MFDDPLVPPIRQLLAQGQLRWITDEAQRTELGRVLSYSKVAPRVAFYEKTAAGVLAAFDAAVQCVPTAPKVRFTCTDPAPGAAHQQGQGCFEAASALGHSL